MFKQKKKNLIRDYRKLSSIFSAWWQANTTLYKIQKASHLVSIGFSCGNHWVKFKSNPWFERNLVKVKRKKKR